LSGVTIVNARILTGGALREGSIVAEEGKITKIGRSPSPVGEIMDAHGRLVLPGLVDLHVHFREPGATQKEDFYTGSCAAAAGGVTTVLDEPNNTPVIDTPSAFKQKLDTIKGKALVDYDITIALNDHNLDDLPEFKSLGATTYAEFDELGDKPTGLTNAGALLDAMRAVKRVNGLLLMNCREAEIVDHETRRLCGAGRNSFGDYNSSFPRVAESVAAAKRILMAESIGVRAHLHDGDTARPRCIEGQYDRRGETRPPLPQRGRLGFPRPPRPAVDPNTAERGHKGTLECPRYGARGHSRLRPRAPHPRREETRLREHLGLTPGIPAVETMLPLLLTEVSRGSLTLARLVKASSSTPAKILGIHPRKGEIALGSDADLIIVDPDEEWTIKGEELHGKTRWTPYEGRRVRGRPLITFVRGTLTYDRGEVLGEPGQGRRISLETH